MLAFRLVKIDYDSLAIGYARCRSVNPRTLERLKGIGEVTEDSKVLEVGCGSGNYLAALVEATGCRGHGLDSSVAMLTQVFWDEPGFTPITVQRDRLGRSARVMIYSYQEQGE